MSDYPQVGGSYVINEKGEFVRRTEDEPKPEVTQEKPGSKTKNATDEAEK